MEKALFVDLISDWNGITTLPKSLREKLSQVSSLNIRGEIFESSRKDTFKALFTLKDGEKIEAVLMRHRDKRNTVCVSSQVGCSLGCKFCATGGAGFERNLDWEEIVEQVLFFARILKTEGKKVSNVVFMGMGEPFLNYENVWGAIRFLNSKDTFNLGARRISISTIGITEGIRKMAREGLEVNLAVSLHAPTDELREKIIPINKKYKIQQVLEAVDYYIDKTNRKVMFEYLLIKDFNDSEEEARKLARLMKQKLYLVNLIPCNFVGEFKAPEAGRIKRFRNILGKEGVQVTQRVSQGRDIAGACGQLAGKK